MLASKPKEQFLADWKARQSLEQESLILPATVTAKNRVKAAHAQSQDVTPIVQSAKMGAPKLQ